MRSDCTEIVNLKFSSWLFFFYISPLSPPVFTSSGFSDPLLTHLEEVSSRLLLERARHGNDHVPMPANSHMDLP